MSKKPTQHDLIMDYFEAGGTLTVAKALYELGVYALSQRCGELKQTERGKNIKSRTIKTATGKWVNEWYLPLPPTQPEQTQIQFNERPTA